MRRRVHLQPSASSHRSALQLEVLQVLGEVDADHGDHVFGDDLPLAGVVVQLGQDLLEGGVVAESATRDETSHQS